MLIPKIDVPTFKTITAYDASLAPITIRGLDVNAPGQLVIDDIYGTRGTYTILSGTTPFRIEAQIGKIVGDGLGGVGTSPTGTDIALTDMIGLQ